MNADGIGLGLTLEIFPDAVGAAAASGIGGGQNVVLQDAGDFVWRARFATAGFGQPFLTTASSFGRRRDEARCLIVHVSN